MTCLFLLKKSRISIIVGISFLVMISACSSDQRAKRQVSGNDVYLDTPALKELKTPKGMVLPLQNANYDIPLPRLKGNVGKELDIRPPVQVLPLLTGSQTQYSATENKLLLENNQQNQHLWQDIIDILHNQHITISDKKNEANNQILSTNWVEWSRADEDVQYEGRYEIKIKQQEYQQQLSVKTLELRQQGQKKPETSPLEIQRYNSMMINLIISGIDKKYQQLNANNNKGSSTAIDVQSGANDTGFPVIILRETYSKIWTSIPDKLEKLGMKVNDSNRQQGTISISYSPISDKERQQLGVTDPGLASGKYKLQLGDLGNRTSIQFAEDKGALFTQSQNDALVPLFKAAYSK